MFLCRTKAASLATVLLLLFSVPSLQGDLKYEETTRITGGFMEGLSKMAGFFGAKGLNNMASVTYLKGDMLRTDNLTDAELTSSEIIQLDREQFVSIDHKRKSYSIVTFAERRAQMEKAIEDLKNKSSKKEKNQPTEPSKNPDVKLEPKIEIKDTGETKVINGFNARHVILTLMLEGEDQKTKDKGALGTNMDLWLTKDLSGFDERNQFYQRYAEKMASPAMMRSLAMSPAMAQDPRMAQAIQALKEKAEALEGEAVLTIASFDLSGTPGQAQSSQPSQTGSQPQSSQKDSESPESVGQAIGKALGGFGGLGGFGRKKKKEEPSQQPAAQPGSAPEATATASLMTMTTELKSFSKAPLHTALFEIPAGYKLDRK